MSTFQTLRRGGPGDDRTTERPRRDVRAPDHGFTLVEVLVAMVLISVGVLTVIGALATTIRGSSAHEHKIVALAALASGSAAIQERPSSCGAYQGLVDGALADLASHDWGGVGVPAVTVSASCGAELDVVTLTVQTSGSAARPLEVVVGGPRPGAGGGPSEDNEVVPTPVGDASCALTSIVGTPSTIGWEDPATQRLAGDVVVSVRTTGNCVTMRAVMTLTGPTAWFPSLNQVSPGVWEYVVGGGLDPWDAGPAEAQIQNLRSSGWADVGAGTAFEVIPPVGPECTVVTAAASPDPAEWQNSSQRRLRDPLTITASVSGTCDNLSFRVDTGEELVGPTAMTGSGDTFEGSIAGHPHGPQWALGTHTIEFLDGTGSVIGSTTIEVQS